MYKKLYRSEKDRMIAGVCGGIGEYFDIDPTLIRLLFILILVSGGSGLLIYIVLWIIVPTESCAKTDSDEVIAENAKEIKEKVVKTAEGIKTTIKSDNRSK